MKKIFLFILLPVLGFSQKVTVTPFYLNTVDKMVCFTVTIENVKGEGIYLFQKKLNYTLTYGNNTSKVQVYPDHIVNRGYSNYQQNIYRDKKNGQYEALQKHLTSLKDKCIVQDLQEDSCNIKLSDTEYAIQWYNNFLEDILFIPPHGKTSVLTYAFSIDKISKLDFILGVEYYSAQTEKFSFETFNSCHKKKNVWWYVPHKYEHFTRMKSDIKKSINVKL